MVLRTVAPSPLAGQKAKTSFSHLPPPTAHNPGARVLRTLSPLPYSNRPAGRWSMRWSLVHPPRHRLETQTTCTQAPPKHAHFHTTLFLLPTSHPASLSPHVHLLFFDLSTTFYTCPTEFNLAPHRTAPHLSCSRYLIPHYSHRLTRPHGVELMASFPEDQRHTDLVV